mmetsp:Transcript_83120/g.269091  ORF Transcript_83120/g.269091 Transcript_83120/m.269091 type:complete len:144 (-) Transcript_83120:77-508(-)
MADSASPKAQEVSKAGMAGEVWERPGELYMMPVAFKDSEDDSVRASTSKRVCRALLSGPWRPVATPHSPRERRRPVAGGARHADSVTAALATGVAAASRKRVRQGAGASDGGGGTLPSPPNELWPFPGPASAAAAAAAAAAAK